MKKFPMPVSFDQSLTEFCYRFVTRLLQAL